MISLVEMFGGVCVFGTITTADMAARQTLPEGNPFVPSLHTVFTNTGIMRREFFDLITVGTSTICHISNVSLSKKFCNLMCF